MEGSAPSLPLLLLLLEGVLHCWVAGIPLADEVVKAGLERCVGEPTNGPCGK